MLPSVAWVISSLLSMRPPVARGASLRAWQHLATAVATTPCRGLHGHNESRETYEARRAARPRLASYLPHRLQQLRLLVEGDGVDERVDLAVEDARDAVDGQVHTVVGHAVLREVVRADLLGAL